MPIDRRTLFVLFIGLTAVPEYCLAEGPGMVPSAQLSEPYQVGRARPPLEDGRALEAMTLDAAVAHALEHNLDIRQDRLEPQIRQYAMLGAQAAFRPTVSTTLGYNNATSSSTSQLDGAARITTEQGRANLSISQLLPWAGTRVSASFDNSRTSTNNAFATRNPLYATRLDLSLTQPLLAGRRTDAQRNALRTQELLGQIADIELRAQVIHLSAQVRQSYWNLRAAIEQIEIQRRSLAQAEQLLENNRIQVQQGLMVELDLAYAEAQVAAAQQALLNAEIQWRNRELAFKRLLVGGIKDPLMAKTVDPVDQPQFEDPDVDIAAAIEQALQERPELRQLRRQQRIAAGNLQVRREDTRPNLNLAASYTLSGVGGDLFSRAELGGAPQLVEPGGYLDGLGSIAGFDTPTFNLSLNFSYPLGTSTADAALAQARLQVRQSELELESRRMRIEMEVTEAGLAVSNHFLQLEAARRSREAAERAAAAEMMRLEVGAATNYQVVTAQNILTSARLSELRALLGYIDARAEFRRVQGIGW